MPEQQNFDSYVFTASERMKRGHEEPSIYSLVGSFWYSGELVIFFGGTGSGKSICSVQIADYLSKGESIDPEHMKNEAEPQPVLYFDFELTDRQFFKRYSPDHDQKEKPDLSKCYQFSPNLKICTIPFGMIYKSGENITQKIFNIINRQISRFNAKILIIDNITVLSSKDSSDGNTAMEIMSFLDRLKREQKISILVIGHMPKKYIIKPITIDDLAGSSKLSYFSDSVFAIGNSVKDDNLRYLKQVKIRTDQANYGTMNVLTLNKIKYNNFLGFKVEGTTIEDEHIDKNGDDLKLQVISMYNQGKSCRDIEKELGGVVKKSTINNWTKNERQR